MRKLAFFGGRGDPIEGSETATMLASMLSMNEGTETQSRISSVSPERSRTLRTLSRSDGPQCEDVQHDRQRDEEARMNMYGNVPIIRSGTSVLMRWNGPGVVSAARLTTFASASRPRTFQINARRIPERRRVASHAMTGAEAPT